MTRSGVQRVARAALVLYAVCTAFGIAGFFLMGRALPFPASPEFQQRSFELGMRYTAPATIWAGFLAATAGAVHALGWRRALTATAGVVGVTLAVELVGARTGWPFGEHGYGTELGWRVAGLVPAVIPASWWTMLYACLAIARRYGRGTAATIAITTLGMLAWDILMEPAMSRAYPFWQWRQDGVWYGMPVANLATWAVIAPVIAAIALRAAGDRLADASQHRLPTAIYLVTAVMPLMLTIRFQLWLPTLLGGALMLLFLLGPRLRVAGAARAEVP